MTTSEFRSTPTLVTALRQVFDDPTLKLWLETFNEDENPANGSPARGITETDAGVMLGEQTGWNLYRRRFLLGAKPLEPIPTEGEQDYSKPADEE